MPSPGPVPAPADVLLSDGSVAVIRPMLRSDQADLVGLHERASEESIRLRFFAVGHLAGRRYIERLFLEPSGRTLALVAVKNAAVVGLATAEVLQAGTAEIALLVADLEHGHGLGTLLLEHLAALARAQGLSTFVAEVLADNTAMLHVLRDTGFPQRLRSTGGVVYVRMDVSACAEAVLAADQREFHSEALSLRPLLYPRTVAVAGSRPSFGGRGRAIVAAIEAGGFTGSLFVVHPDGRAVAGLPAYATVGDIPVHVDLLVVASAPARVMGLVRDAGRAGVSSVVVVSSGLGGEAGSDRARQQRALVRLARDHSVRVVGPRSLGLVSNDRAVRLDATSVGGLPPYGGLAVASQAGGDGRALLDLAVGADLGVHCFVSLGDKADVSSNDLLSAWIDDPQVTGAALCLRSFGNAGKFARIARRFSERKPIVAVMAGRASGGSRGGAARTAAPAATALGVRAVFAHAGVMACRTAKELAETARLLSEQPLPAGRRVAVVGDEGGLGARAARLLGDDGLVVPTLSVASRPSALLDCVDTLLGSDEVDSLLVTLAATRLSEAEAMVDAVVSGRRQHPDKPVLLVGAGFRGVTGPPAGVTALSTLSGAARALRHVTAYAEWCRTPHEDPAPVDTERAAAGRAAARRALREDAGRQGWVPRTVAADLLGRYGVEPSGEVVGFEAPGRAATVPGVELVVGIVRDPVVGPLVTVAAGGTPVDLEENRNVLVPPVPRPDAERALRSLGAWAHPDGTMGTSPADVEPVVDLVERLGQLAVEVPEVAYLALDRVVAGAEGLSVPGAKLRLAKAPPLVDSGVPRRLRDLDPCHGGRLRR